MVPPSLCTPTLNAQYLCMGAKVKSFSQRAPVPRGRSLRAVQDGTSFLNMLHISPVMGARTRPGCESVPCSSVQVKLRCPPLAGQ